MKNDADRVLGAVRRRRTRGWTEVLGGAALVIVAVVASRMTHTLASFASASVPVFVGCFAMWRGTLQLMAIEAGLAKPSQQTHTTHSALEIGVGFRTFVAWRYLMARDHRVSRFVLFVLFLALAVVVASFNAQLYLITAKNPMQLEHDKLLDLARFTLGGKIAGVVLIYFAVLIGALRYVFSFFTTVPLVGVWIGTGALVCVLAVMSGFETDLREKILGSNAHIRITREEGDFTNWREIKAQVDKVPGVVATTPYAESEVVLAANNNGMPVIIKGIDPATVGKVTDLVRDLKDKDALKRLDPLVDDTRDLTVPDKGPQGSGSNVVDPPPADMPGAGDPIDFSQPTDDPTGASADPNQPPPIDEPAPEPPPPPLHETPPPPPSAGSADTMPPADLPKGLAKHAADDTHAVGDKQPMAAPGSDYGGDANDVQKPVVDPPPPDLVTTDEEPQDFSGGGSDDDTIHVVDVGDGSLSRRTQSLPGILVGTELVKQVHLYTGEEVRIVSPLSDPANPDANGTPIPFNRDYRIAGQFYTGMYEYDLKVVYVTLDSLTDFLDRGDVVDGIEVRIGSPDDTDRYVGRLQTLLGKQYRVVDWKELNHSLFSALKLEKIAMFLVLGIVILVASFSIVGNLIMVVVEKGREIALLKTLGASDRSLMIVFAIQGLLIGVVGTGLGVATGLAACWFGKAYGIPLNPDVYYIDRMPVHVDPTSVGITAAAGVLISMAATFYPALVAARVRPAAGMRH